jgi:3-hydroxybutyryl-CoA dehydratase
MELVSKTINDLKVGDKYALTQTITEEVIQAFAKATGDFNPVHMDEEYAKGTAFGGRIAHGMLFGGYFSNIIGTKLPGAGTVYMSQTLNFRKPVRINDVITTEVEVIAINTEKGRATLATTCRNQEGHVVVEGEALVSLKRKK